jgi:hypothetical protein
MAGLELEQAWRCMGYCLHAATHQEHAQGACKVMIV